MKKYLVCSLLFLSLDMQGLASIYHQITIVRKNNRFLKVLKTVAPIIPSLISLGSFVVARIKNKKKNDLQTNEHTIDYQEQITIKQTLKKQHNQLKSLNTLYYCYYQQEISNFYKEKLKQRTEAIQKLINGEEELTMPINYWPYLDNYFAKEFNFSDYNLQVREGVELQHILNSEFGNIANETELFWRRHYKDCYIQQLIEKSIFCIQEGMACSKSGEVVKATLFADVGWAILDHIKAIGEGMHQGTIKAVELFVHPLNIKKIGSDESKQFVSSLGRVTLEIIDFYTLAIHNPGEAQKKLQIWRQHFLALLNHISQEWDIKTKRDITKFVAAFVTERMAVYGVFNGLVKIFMAARISAANLGQQKDIKQTIQKRQMVLIKDIDVQKQITESVQDVPEKSA